MRPIHHLGERFSPSPSKGVLAELAGLGLPPCGPLKTWFISLGQITMRTKLLLAVMICAALQAAGCVYHVPDTDRQRHTDVFFHDRHPDPDASYHDPMMKVAQR